MPRHRIQEVALMNLGTNDIHEACQVACQEMHKREWCHNATWIVIENQFMGYKLGGSVTNMVMVGLAEGIAGYYHARSLFGVEQGIVRHVSSRLKANLLPPVPLPRQEGQQGHEFNKQQAIATGQRLLEESGNREWLQRLDEMDRQHDCFDAYLQAVAFYQQLATGRRKEQQKQQRKALKEQKAKAEKEALEWYRDVVLPKWR